MIQFLHACYTQSSPPPTRGLKAADSQFANLARRIKDDFAPQSVLDIGCAGGLLVNELRALDIQAWGICAPGQAADSPFCHAAPLDAPFPQQYDLIVCLEYLAFAFPGDTKDPAAEAEGWAGAVIANICRHTSEVLFSTPPPYLPQFAAAKSQFMNPYPPATWAEFFARHGFYHDLAYESLPQIPWGMRFFQAKLDAPQIVAGYESRLWSLQDENRARRDLSIEMREELSNQATEAAQLRRQVEHLRIEKDRQAWIENPPDASSLETLRPAALTDKHKERLLRECELAFAQREQALRDKEEIQAAYTEIINSTSWRFMRAIHKIRHWLIPLDSQRERWLYRLMGRQRE